jgi:hypothetical protein
MSHDIILRGAAWQCTSMSLQQSVKPPQLCGSPGPGLERCVTSVRLFLQHPITPKTPRLGVLVTPAFDDADEDEDAAADDVDHDMAATRRYDVL